MSENTVTFNVIRTGSIYIQKPEFSLCGWKFPDIFILNPIFISRLERSEPKKACLLSLIREHIKNVKTSDGELLDIP